MGRSRVLASHLFFVDSELKLLHLPPFPSSISSLSVCVQLHFFKPNPRVIKKRIETLIDREYLERDSADPNTYKYLA
jgi:hypothetical protein